MFELLFIFICCFLMSCSETYSKKKYSVTHPFLYGETEFLLVDSYSANYESGFNGDHLIDDEFSLAIVMEKNAEYICLSEPIEINNGESHPIVEFKVFEDSTLLAIINSKGGSDNKFLDVVFGKEPFEHIRIETQYFFKTGDRINTETFKIDDSIYLIEYYGNLEFGDFEDDESVFQGGHFFLLNLKEKTFAQINLNVFYQVESGVVVVDFISPSKYLAIKDFDVLLADTKTNEVEKYDYSKITPNPEPRFVWFDDVKNRVVVFSSCWNNDSNAWEYCDYDREPEIKTFEIEKKDVEKCF